MHDSSTARDVRPIATITEPEAVRPGHTRFVAAIESSPRGSFIVVGFLHVALWTPATGDRSGAGACPCDVVESLAWGQDGQPGPWRSTWRSSAPVPNQGCAGEWSEERFRRSRGLRPRVPTGSTGSAVTRASGRPGSRGRGNSDPRGAVSVSGRPGHPPCRRGVVQLVVKERAKEGCGDGRGGEGPPPRVRCRATSLPTRDWDGARGPRTAHSVIGVETRAKGIMRQTAFLASSWATLGMGGSMPLRLAASSGNSSTSMACPSRLRVSGAWSLLTRRIGRSSRRGFTTRATACLAGFSRCNGRPTARAAPGELAARGGLVAWRGPDETTGSAPADPVVIGSWSPARAGDSPRGGR